MCVQCPSWLPGTSCQQIPDRSRRPQQEPARPSLYGIPNSVLGPVPRWLMPPPPVPPPSAALPPVLLPPLIPPPLMPPPLLPPHLVPPPHIAPPPPLAQRPHIPRQRVLPAADLPPVEIPPCDKCYDLGMVWHEQRVEKTTKCVLCGGAGSIKLASTRDGGPCWHCHGEGETKCAGIEGDWIQCYCELPPGRRPSERKKPRPGLERRWRAQS